MTAPAGPPRCADHRVERAGASDADALAEVIASAFHDLDVSRWLVPDPGTRRAIFPGYFGIHVGHALADGLVLTTPARDAAALWIPVGAGGPGEPPEQYHNWLETLTGPHLDRFRALDAGFDAHHPAGVAYEYLAILAVRPGRQRLGIGTALLNARHARLDRDGTAAYLEASDPAKREIYLEHGYADYGDPIRLPDGPVMFPMWREPRRLAGLQAHQPEIPPSSRLVTAPGRDSGSRPGTGGTRKPPATTAARDERAMMPRESRAAREGLQPVVYRYAVKGRIPEAVANEVRRAHILRNKVTEIMRDSDQRVAELHAGQPEAAVAQEAAEKAAARVKELADGIQARKAAGRTRRPDPQLSAQLSAAKAELTEARTEAKRVKKAVRERLKEPEKTIRDQAAAALKALYAQASGGSLYEGTPVSGGVYWATYNMVTTQQQLALQKVISRRSQGLPAELSFRRWDGAGTIAVQPQRGADGPPRTPAALADPAGKWRNVIFFAPGRTEAEWTALPPAERKRAEIRIRVGSGESVELATLRIVYHRPIPDGADIVGAQVTITRITSTRLRASVALTVQLPAPQAKAGGPVAAIHTGWRVLEDGAIRVAVITGAVSPPPAGTGVTKDAASARRRSRARLAGKRSGVPGRPWAGNAPLAQECGIRDHGDWQEVVMPPGVRDLAAHADSLGGIRDRNMNQARKNVASFMEQFPDTREETDPRGSLDRWRSPGRFRAALASMEQAAPEAEQTRQLRAWAVQDIHLELWESYESRRHVYGWRQDLYRNVAAWLAADAAVIVADSWPAVRTRPGPGEEDTAQMQAARANAALAAPGSLRQQVQVAAGRRGTRYVQAPGGLAGIHHGCGGELPADERARGVIVICRGCGRKVDQDLNTARAMTAVMLAEKQILSDRHR